MQADLAALRMTGTCRGLQNYSRHFENREPGTPPSTLMDYFPANFLTIIDESHNTINQIKYAGAGPPGATKDPCPQWLPVAKCGR